MTNLAPGMKAILELRKTGKRPALPVIVWLTKSDGQYENAACWPRIDERYDWLGLLGLDVIIRSERGIGGLGLVSDIMRQKEKHPGGEVHLIDQKRKRGARVYWTIKPNVTSEELKNQGSAALRYGLKLSPWSVLDNEGYFNADH